jgi:hypothetical protein
MKSAETFGRHVETMTMGSTSIVDVIDLMRRIDQDTAQSLAKDPPTSLAPKLICDTNTYTGTTICY